MPFVLNGPTQIFTVSQYTSTQLQFSYAGDISVIQAKQSIPHDTLTFHEDCVKMCEDFGLNFGDK
jgi:hypothetical protein